jgi:predicted nucleic acid-binding protein
MRCETRPGHGRHRGSVAKPERGICCSAPSDPAGRGALLLSAALLIEYEATCQLAEHRLASGLTAGEVEAFLDGLAFLAEPVEVHYRWRPQLQDPGDEMVLEAAVNGRAHALVTFNRRDYGEVPETFGVEVLSPAEVLRRIQG